MNILITGASGFIGKNLVEILGKKNKIYTILRNETKIENINFLKEKKINYIFSDIKSKIKNINQKIDVIIHLAAILGNQKYKKRDYYNTNVLGTKNIIAFAKEKKVKKLIFVSSIAVVNYKDYELNDSNRLYGWSKNEAEKLVRKSKLNYTIIRPGIIFGKYNLNLFPLFYIINKGFFIYMNNEYNNIRFIYVNDLCNLIKKAIFQYKNKTILFSGKKIMLQDFVNIIFKNLNKKVRKLKIPRIFVKLYLRLIAPIVILLKFNPYLTWTSYYILTKEINYGLSIRFKYTNYTKSINETVKWYKKQGMLR